MYKSILISLAFLLATSCIDNRATWLQEYQNTKCIWAKVEEKLELERIQSTRKLNIELIVLNREVDEIAKPIQSKIALLNHKINGINIKYLNESRKICEAHEQIHGHISTPEFEKKLKQNDENNNREVLILESKITVLQSKLNDNKAYLDFVLKQNKTEEQIVKITTILKEKYTVTFDSLQKELDNQNYNYKYILQKLSNTEKESFKSQREKIKTHPCK